ncbi:MAG: hypothetical protein JOZ02_13255 [Acidobacteria bacterium]|nr:hypothetical protein [Acidobacteriota bacterium]
MPAAEGKTADVRPIYRKGDRVLVELESGFYDVVIHVSEFIAGELWLYGIGPGFIKTFPAGCIVRRLAPGEALTWPGSE